MATGIFPRNPGWPWLTGSFDGDLISESFEVLLENPNGHPGNRTLFSKYIYFGKSNCCPFVEVNVDQAQTQSISINSQVFFFPTGRNEN